MKLSHDFWKTQVHQLVEARGSSEAKNISQSLQPGDDETVLAWCLLNMPREDKGKALLDLLISRDSEQSLTTLSRSIDSMTQEGTKGLTELSQAIQLFNSQSAGELKNLMVAIEKFNKDSGRLYIAYLCLTVVIAAAAVVSTCATWQMSHQPVAPMQMKNP